MELKRRSNKSINPDEAVAIGAAIIAGIINNDDSDFLKDITLLDVIPLSVGIETVGGFMNVAVNRNENFPLKKTVEFTTDKDNQTSVNIQIYEGERPLTKDNHLLGKFILDGIPPMKGGEPKILITFDFDNDGILSVSAKESSGLNENNIVIKNELGRLSKDEIKRITFEAEMYKAQDKAILQAGKIINDLGNYFSLVMEIVAEEPSKNLLRDIDKNIIKDEHETYKVWSEKRNEFSLEQIISKSNHITKTIDSILNKINKKLGITFDHLRTKPSIVLTKSTTTVSTTSLTQVDEID